MFSQIPTTDRAVDALVKEINANGYGVIEGAVPELLLRDMRGVVAEAVQRSGREYVALTGTKAMEGTVFGAIGENADFQALMQQLFASSTGLRPPPMSFYQVLRCLSGKSVHKHSLNFHYDSYVVTALIPVEIPTTGSAGDLILLPNIRPIRRTYARNVIDKMILDNRLSQSLLAFVVKRGWIDYIRCRLVPGNLYIFWGYRTVHTNEPPEAEKIRATVLYHYANPHEASAVMRKVRRSALAPGFPPGSPTGA